MSLSSISGPCKGHVQLCPQSRYPKKPIWIDQAAARPSAHPGSFMPCSPCKACLAQTSCKGAVKLLLGA